MGDSLSHGPMSRARALYLVVAVTALGLITTANRLGATTLQIVGRARILGLAEVPPLAPWSVSFSI